MNHFKNASFIVFLLGCIFSFTGKAQSPSCQKGKSANGITSLYYCASNLRSDTMDILKYTINLNITDFATDTIRGNTTVKFTPKINGQNKLRLDLLKMFVDSIKLNTSKLTYSYTDTLLKVNLPASYNTTDTLSVTVYYHGKPQGDPLGWGGFYFSGNYAYNLGVGFGANPHTYGRVWFPCFDNFVEKSQYEFNITTDTLKSSYCNGQLISDIKTGNTHTRKWVMQKEITSYLASVAVADYTQVNWSAPLMQGTTPIILTARPSDTTAMKNGFVNLKNALAGFENRYGPYVWNRVGYCLVPFNNGAMEHATNISYPQVTAGNLAYEADIMAHELSHHWWGDLMTCETQEDMWLNEGMATYSQYIFKEWVYGKSQYMSDVKTTHDYLVHFAHFVEKVYWPVSGVPFQYTYGDHVYKKGADMAHTLRSYMGDTAFFAGLKYVLTQKAYKNMNSDEFRQLLEASSGQSLTSFFNRWVLSGGWPHFSIDSTRYVPQGGGSYLGNLYLKQKLTGCNVYYNNVPLEITFFDSNWNKIVKKVTMFNPTQSFTVSLPFNPVYSAINYDSKISDAISSEYKTIKTTGTSSYVLGKATLTITNVGVDSSLIRIEHNYAVPDPIKYNVKSYKLSNQHYWKVDGILSPGFLSKIRFNFDGNPVPTGTNIPSGGAYAYLDTCLTSANGDSITILYRRNTADDWREVTKFTKFKVPGLGRSGYFTVDTLKLGEYCFANKKGANLIGIKTMTEKKIKLKVFPNPASNNVTLALEEYNLNGKEILEIRNVEGKLIHSQNVRSNSTVLDCSTFAKGTYFANIISNGKIISKEKIILQ